MKILSSRFVNILRILMVVIVVFTGTSCVYFNTFYNAKLFFGEAEKLRLEKQSDILPNNIRDKYSDVINKSDIVINNYADSKYYDEALYLKGRSHYHRNEYDLAESSFNTLRTVNNNEYSILSDYWLALIKWKTGRPLPALEHLNEIISVSDDYKLLAEAYRSKADILLELKQEEDAILALENAAELTKKREEKSNIYERLAELTYNSKNYKQSIQYYENFIKFSLSSEDIMEANLKIVQRYRDLDDSEKASKEIQSMLDESEFLSIHDKLKLELAKLYISKDDNIGITILDEIVVEYPKTETSAEAFFILGEQYLLDKRDFEKADFYYKQVLGEFPGSALGQPTRKRIIEIDKYNLLHEQLKPIFQTNLEDSIKVQSKSQLDTANIAVNLYNLGELEAFHFNRIDTAIVHFERIFTDFSDLELTAKAIYALYFLNEKKGDTLQSKFYQERLMEQYPDSEYAEHIRTNFNLKEYGISGFTKLAEIEKLYLVKRELALKQYKILAKSLNSEPAIRALLFIANEYDYNLFNSDSASKYYNEIVQRFPNSEQANVANGRLMLLIDDKADIKKDSMQSKNTKKPMETVKAESITVNEPPLTEAQVIEKEQHEELMESVDTNKLNDFPTDPAVEFE